VYSSVDVAEGALLQALGEGIVLFVRDVFVGLLEQFLGPVQSADMI
jgi:hypothetical protein